MKKLFGNTGGLKSNQIRRLENLYRRRIAPDYIITPELARDICRISHEIRRQIGILITRAGKIYQTVIGDHAGIVIPATTEYRTSPGRLKGLRLVHTHLDNEPLSGDDCTDLALLRLDLIAAITITAAGLANQVHVGHIMPSGTEGKPYQILPPMPIHQLDDGCLELIQALEAEMVHLQAAYAAAPGRETALLVSVGNHSKSEALAALQELRELALSSNIRVADSVWQHRRKKDPRLLMGRGKLQDLTIMALQKGVSLIIFDQELNPSQSRSITDKIDLKVIDRTQLILDIFAQRARSREGRLQVELAQLKYLLPRLISKNTAMSRLTGGIGGRGPGETKLEINRRRVRQRIRQLEGEVTRVGRQRRQQKSLRNKRQLPIISIIGYTNAGKSTLLNTLTRSRVHVENRLFATLDPSSRRLKFPRETEVIITDTVGFIKDLPSDLRAAFRATLEELESADLLLHVIDASSPRLKAQLESVEEILSELNLRAIPLLRVLNKQDRVAPDTMARLCADLDGIPISATRKSTLMPLIETMERFVQRRSAGGTGKV